MKIAVYCPVKNEAKHIDAWYASCEPADYICVLDTGSTDGTREKLQALPRVQVTQAIIKPWRFDDAFNMAMYTVPEDADVCIRLDLDERLQPGWRTALESVWKNGVTRLRYPYVWNWRPDGTPGKQWYSDRIHARVGYRWVGPTHEYLMCRTEEKLEWTDQVRIHQYPDFKPKTQDLSLLQEFVREYPHDMRALAYLGREYLYRGNLKESAKVYKKFVHNGTDPVELGQAYLNLAKCEPEFATQWLDLAKNTIPDHREPSVALAELYYQRQQWSECLAAIESALAITKHPMTYICNENSWTSYPYDIASIAAWNLLQYEKAYQYGERAVNLSPNDTRLAANLKIFKQQLGIS